MERVDVILAAAGQGARMGLGYNKARLEFMGLPLYAHSLKLACSLEWVEKIILVAPKVEIPIFEQQLISFPWLAHKKIHLIAGGKERYQSVQKGLEFLAQQPNPAPGIFVHDAARPLGGAALWERIRIALGQQEAVCPILPIHGTLRMELGESSQALPPGKYFTTQTPQAFRQAWLAKAFLTQTYAALKPSEEMKALEFAGAKVHYVLGELKNSKITLLEDLLLFSSQDL